MKHRCGILQSLLDVAVVETGSLETAFALAVANDMAVTDGLTNGQELELVPVVRPDIARRFSVSGMQPATAISEEEIPLSGGIGHMAIEIDLVVS